MPHVHDVVILGAGPAGCSTAIELLQRKPGTDVLLLEGIKRDNTLEPGQPGAGHSMCSGGLPTMFIERQIGWDIPANVVMTPVKRAIVRGPSVSVEVDNEYLRLPGRELGLITNRKRLDDWLVGWARKEGADYRNDQRIASIARENGHWLLRTRKGEEHRAKFLVGADGPESMVAQQFLGAPAIRDEDMYVASEVYVPASGKYHDDAVMLQWQTSRIKGYYWTFSGGPVVKVGLCTTRASGVNPGKENDWWRAKMRAEYDDAAFTGPSVESVGGRITASPPLRNVVDAKAGVAVVGEAARAVWAEIAAGDAPAFETGRGLGRFLAEGQPEKYQAWFRRTTYGVCMRHWRFKNMLCGFDDQQLDRAIGLLQGFRPKTNDINRNAVQFLAFGLRKDPLMLMKAMRAAVA
ncbi:MAG: NAD(P)/FAD-dependent oxidoreductase [Halobacteriales archaeon]|nr:NAD(P)/FAD-dependent oxidoreductase [Halobacteriales archaeon]